MILEKRCCFQSLAFKAAKVIAILGVFIYAGDKWEAIRLDTRTVTFTTHAERDAGNLVDGIEKKLNIPVLLARAEMTDAEFNAMMQDGLRAAKADHSSAVSEVFADLRRELCI